jgi:transcription factor IIIB subunit 2
MAAGRYRWGRKAKLTAAASVAVALRESRRSDSLRDIAFLINEQPLALSRAFSSLLSLLNLSITSADPGLHLPALHLHLSTLLQTPGSLPTTLLALLAPLSLATVIRTANALSTLVTRLGDALPTAHLPTPSTACAILILALEAETRTSLPNLSDLAHHLGARVSAGKGTVLSRYKLLYDLVEEWIREVPWLDKFTSKNGRSKIAKRVIVARGLKDVVQFQVDIWRKKLEAADRPTVSFDAEDEVRDDGNESDMPQPGIEPAPVRPRKKPKTDQALIDASHFLLDPLSAPPPSAGSATPHRSPLPLAAYLLTAEPSVLSLQSVPTRLQRLATDRGGEDAISDNELFEEGEWEGMLRTEGERDVLREAWGWEKNDDETAADREEVVKRDDERGWVNIPTSKRINMEALSKLLRGTNAYGEVEELFGLGYPLLEGADDLGERSKHEHSDERVPKAGDSSLTDVEVVEAWRPLSPDRSSVYNSGVPCTYDEEC